MKTELTIYSFPVEGPVVTVKDHGDWWQIYIGEDFQINIFNEQTLEQLKDEIKILNVSEDESEADVAICEQCKDESIDPPALATEQRDGRWLCEYHAEREAQASAEREADERDAQE